MAGIEIQTGELLKNKVHKCQSCGRIIPADKVRQWLESGHKDTARCHARSYWSSFDQEEKYHVQKLK